MAMTDWVPAECTLPTEEQPLRVAEFDALFADELRSVSRPDTHLLRLVLSGGSGTEQRTRDLVDRETGCCSFFTFTLAAESEALVLDVEVPAAHRNVLDALQARASACLDPAAL